MKTTTKVRMNSRPKLATLAWEMGRRNHKSPAPQIVNEEASEKFTHFLKLVVGSVDAVYKRGASDRAPALCAHVQGGSEHVVVCIFIAGAFTVVDQRTTLFQKFT